MSLIELKIKDILKYQIFGFNPALVQIFTENQISDVVVDVLLLLRDAGHYILYFLNSDTDILRVSACSARIARDGFVGGNALIGLIDGPDVVY